jgi:hypothetical protein
MGSSVNDPRAEELLVERALHGLDDHERRELEQLGVAGDTTFDIAAAAVAQAAVDREEMPAHVTAKILASAPGLDMRRTLTGVVAPAELPRDTLVGVQLSDFTPASETSALPMAMPMPMPLAVHVPAPVPVTDELAVRRNRSRFATVAPWLAAAACLVIASGAVFYAARDGGGGTAASIASAADGRAELVKNATDLKTIAWTATKDPAATATTGDVIWSEAQQRGYMRFVGLAANDPKQFQYQLWIFDKNRDDKFPVDGGVFDVSSTGEVIIPITARLRVSDATLFAVTIEKPGGVVVSKRERIVVTAAKG